MLAVRFFMRLAAVIAGAIYTIVQTGGPDPAEVASCKLVQKVSPATYDHCVPGFSAWGPSAIAAIALILIILIGIDLFRLFLARRKQ
jgi:hypothetical protein